MATTSEVKAGLDAIADKIAAIRARTTAAVSTVQGSASALAGIPSAHADVIAEVGGYTPTGAFETLAKDELAKLTTEFQVLKAEVDAAVVDLAAYTEF